MLLQNSQRANMRMQHDRFAREIAAILALSSAARLRRLMRNSLGGHARPMQRNASA